MKHKKPGPPRGRKHSDVERTPFGERLYKTRKARGITQTELAEKVSLSKRMITYYEGVSEGPPMKTLTDLANALNVTTSYLLGESTLKKIDDEISPPLKKHIKILNKLPPRDRNAILRMTELAGQNGTNS